MPVEHPGEREEYQYSYNTQESCGFRLCLIKSFIGNGQSRRGRIRFHLLFYIVNHIDDRSILRIAGYDDPSASVVMGYEISRFSHLQVREVPEGNLLS